jgi:hypothetical protein
MLYDSKRKINLLFFFAQGIGNAVSVWQDDADLIELGSSWPAKPAGGRSG